MTENVWIFRKLEYGLHKNYITFIIILVVVYSVCNSSLLRIVSYKCNVYLTFTRDISGKKVVVSLLERRKEGNFLFNDALNTFYLWLYVVGHMVKDQSDSERGNSPILLHGLFFSINSKGSFICTIPQTE